MARDISFLVDTYNIDPDRLWKFDDDEVRKLTEMCQEWDINPSEEVGHYETLIQLIGYHQPNTKGIRGLFTNPGSFSDYIALFNGDKREDALTCLSYTPEDYLREKQRVSELILPLDKQDKRVKPRINSLRQELKKHEELKGLRVAGILWGSFYFGDPSTNPDLDFDLVYCDSSDNPDGIVDRVSKELDIDISSHCSAINLMEYQAILKQVKTNWQEYILELENVSILLVSNPIYIGHCNSNKVNQKLKKLRDQIDEVAKENTLFRAILMGSFNEMRGDRMKKQRPVYS